MNQLSDMIQRISQNHRHFSAIDSTNSALMTDICDARLDANALHLYTADRQSAGRGQRGRNWVSAVGNVFLSLYVPMAHTPTQKLWGVQDDISDSRQGFGLCQLTGRLSLLVGCHLLQLPQIDVVNQQRLADVRIGVKWANDIGYYDISGRFFKLAGILIEPVYLPQSSAMAGVIIGVGLNVASAPQIGDGLYRACCLHDLYRESGASIPLMNADELYLPMTQAIIQAIDTHNGLTDDAALADFVQRFNTAHLLNHQRIDVLDVNGTQIERTSLTGVCLGVDKNGALLVANDMTAKIQPVFAGMIRRVES